jgi:bacillithiol biosynthesis deacetylase BshB1
MADVVAFGAHPDDIEIGCGGTVALLASQGRTIVLVDFTRGETGTRGTVDERAREADAAAKVLGAATRENLELPDGRLPFSMAASSARDGASRLVSEIAVEKVVEVLRRHRPRLVLANFPSDAHPDHVVVGEVVKQARYLAGLAKWQTTKPGQPRHRPQLLLQYFEHEQHAPSLVVDVSAVHERKVAAIRCYRSQLFDPARQEQETALSRPDFIERRVARDRYFGAQAGVTHAEPFCVVGPPKITDPFCLLPESAGDGMDARP